MSAKRIEASTALVVGGTAGIGLACAQALLHAGLLRLTICGRSAERGRSARESLVHRYADAAIAFREVDATDARALHDVVDASAREMGTIDILVSCGGGDPRPRLLHEIPLEDVIPTITMVTSGIVLPARAVLPYMMAQRGGAIICLASDAAKIATPGETVIGAAMAAIVMFCRGMAYEAKRSGIRVNCLTPSIVQSTPLYGRLMEDGFSRKLFGKAETMASLGVVQPEDLAAMAVFLAGVEGAKITGQTISITGGISAI
jgi:2-hydroxycyclohexanecarboxyl-CoA dehydrogenase